MSLRLPKLEFDTKDDVLSGRWLYSDNRASLSPSETVLELPTGTELDNTPYSGYPFAYKVDVISVPIIL